MTYTLIHVLAANPDPVGQWFTKWWPLWLPLLTVIVGGIITGVFAIVNRRGGEQVRSRAPLPPSWPEMWQRIDHLEGLVRQLTDDYARMKEIFLAYVERVQGGGSANLTPDENSELKRTA